MRAAKLYRAFWPSLTDLTLGVSLEESESSQGFIDVGTEYEIPLGHGDLVKLGLFTAVFSQVDYLLTVSISLVSKSPIDDLTTIVDGMTLGVKMNTFKRLSRGLKDKEIKDHASSIVSELQKVIEKRNHLVHGMWARKVFLAEKATKVVCHFNKRDEAPIFPQDLDEINLSGINLTKNIGSFIVVMSKDAVYSHGTPRRMIVANDDELNELPDWLEAPVGLLKMGYSNPDESPQEPPHPPGSSRT